MRVFILTLIVGFSLTAFAGEEQNIDTDAIVKEFKSVGIIPSGSCEGKSLDKRFAYREGMDITATDLEATLRLELEYPMWRARIVDSIERVYEGSEFLGWTINFCRIVVKKVPVEGIDFAPEI